MPPGAGILLVCKTSSVSFTATGNDASSELNAKYTWVILFPVSQWIRLYGKYRRGKKLPEGKVVPPRAGGPECLRKEI